MKYIHYTILTELFNQIYKKIGNTNRELQQWDKNGKTMWIN